ncbi:MAG TPA: SPOR domain-containing protein [bacterium]|jgi:hypothetical protein|nr:SPOR domain-containing protein [bacterium]HNT65312.1 SPOR domain-containing protein [bacterium]
MRHNCGWLLLTVALILWSCAGNQADRPAEVAQPPARGSSGMEFDETFDPAKLGEYALEKPDQPGLSPAFDLHSFLKAGDSSSATNAQQEISGFRIQLISTRDEQEARAVRTDALMQLDWPVYMTFDNPYYKVRVGNFLRRSDAEKEMAEAINRGFVDAWVVRTLIRPQLDSQTESESSSRTAP